METLLIEAKNMTPEYGNQWAFCDIEGERLAVSIESYNGSGQVRSAVKKTTWAYKGKTISAANLKTQLNK